MNRKREEALLRITARYVAELRAGQQPDLGDYIARYPRYAGAIVDFVTYYHAIEADGPQQTDYFPLSDISRAALERALYNTFSSATTKPITTLFATHKFTLTMPQLAAALNLSEDILAQLERRQVDPATLPLELFKRLSAVLQQPLNSIQEYFIAPTQKHSSGYMEKQQLKVAEDQLPYPSQDSAQKQSFSQILEASTQLSVEQKIAWRAMIAGEGLESAENEVEE